MTPMRRELLPSAVMSAVVEGAPPREQMVPCPICSSRVTRRLDITSKGSHLHRCLGCGIVHWDRPWRPGEAVEFYHDYYANRSTELSQVTEKRYHEILQQLERHQSPGSLLEVGCGMGHLLGVAEARGWRPVGLEVSSSGRKQIECLKAQQGWTFQVQEGDVMCAEFPAGSFSAFRKPHVYRSPGWQQFNTTSSENALGGHGFVNLRIPN